MRESEARGVVELEFEHADRLFKIHRVLERVKDDIRQKSDECWLESKGEILAKGKIEPVNEAIASQTRVDTEVMRDVAWIRQERLKLLLSLRREERQVLLDGLLGLEELRRIAENLGEAERRLSEKIRQLESESGGLQDELQDIERKKKRQSTLEAELDELKKTINENRLKLDELERRLSEIRDRVEEYESQQRDISSLQQLLTDLEQSMRKNQANLKRHREKEADLGEMLKNEDQQIRELQEKFRQLGFREPLTRESLNTAIHTLRDKKEHFREQLSDIEHLSEETRRNIVLLQDRDKCPLCRQEMVPLYRSTILQMFSTDLSSKEMEASTAQLEYPAVERNLKSLEEIQESLNMISVEKYQLPMMETLQLIKEMEKEIQNQKREHTSAKLRIEEQKESMRGYTGLAEASREAEEERNRQAERLAGQAERLRVLSRQKKEAEGEIASLSLRVEQKQNAQRESDERKAGLQLAQRVREFLKGIRPRLRVDYLDDLRIEVQRVLDEVQAPEESAYVDLDEYYTPSWIINGQKRNAEQLSGGERTLLAFTLNIGLAQLVYEIKTRQNMEMLLLDEPTESLGTEDYSIERLAETIRSMRSIQQIIAVTHSEDFAQYSDHTLMVTKNLSQSKVEALN